MVVGIPGTRARTRAQRVLFWVVFTLLMGFIVYLELLNLTEHTAAHAELARAELYLKTLVNPTTTTGRLGYMSVSQCGYD